MLMIVRLGGVARMSVLVRRARALLRRFISVVIVFVAMFVRVFVRVSYTAV